MGTERNIPVLKLKASLKKFQTTITKSKADCTFYFLCFKIKSYGS